MLGSTSLVITSIRGSTMHDILSDAFLGAAGYVAIGEELWELLYASFDEGRDDAFRWTARRARYAGVA